MSDPVTNVEIEDVLASIRRLISEGDRAYGQEKFSRLHLAPSARTDDAPLDRYVLTPSLRVEGDSHDPQDEASAATPPADVSDGAEPLQAHTVPEQHFDVIDIDVAATGDDRADDRADDQAAEVSDQEMRLAPEARADTAAEPEPEPVSDPEPEPELETVRQVLSRFAGFDPFEMVSNDSDSPETASASRDSARATKERSDWLPNGSVPTEPASDSDILDDLLRLNDAPQNLDDEQSDDTADTLDEIAFSSARVSLEAKIAELEAAVSGQPDEWEPDGSEVEEKPMEWTSMNQRTRKSGSDAEDAEVIDEAPAAAAAAKQPTTDASLEEEIAAHVSAELADEVEVAVEEEIDHYLEDVGEIDEETLRKLVAEVVREELSGELGERITRNIRKLVRREISRALQVQGFE